MSIYQGGYGERNTPESVVGDVRSVSRGIAALHACTQNTHID